MPNFISSLLRRFVIFQQLIARKMSSSSSPAASHFTSLSDFGYKFNADGMLEKIRIILSFRAAGVLKQVDTNGVISDEGFEFNVHDTHAENQARYEAIGKVIDQEVYSLLQTEGKLERVNVRF